MNATSGILAVAAMLLLGAGLAKAVRPASTALALGVSAWVVRGAAGAEAVLGAYTLSRGGPGAALIVAISYAAFAVYVGSAVAGGRALSSCACFGEPDTPPTRVHVAIDLGLAAGAAAAATGNAAPVGVLQLLPAAVASYLCFLVLSALPRTMASGRP